MIFKNYFIAATIFSGAITFASIHHAKAADSEGSENITETAESLPTSSVGFTTQFENGGTRTNSISGKYYFQNGINFFGSAGASHLVGDSTTKTSRQFNFGAETDSRKLVSVGLSTEYWGLDDAFTYQGAKLPVYLNLREWVFSVYPGGGKATITLANGKEIERDDSSFGAAISFMGVENWTFRLSGEKHEYDFNENVLKVLVNANTDKTSKLFSETTLGLTSSLINSRTGAEITYSFAKFDLGLEVATTEATLDQSQYRSTTLLFDYYHKKNWVFSATAGSSKATDNGFNNTNLTNLDPNRYGSLGVKYKFK